MMCQLLCTGRKWVDFVSFDDRVRESKRLFIVRFEPKQSKLDEMMEKVQALDMLANGDSFHTVSKATGLTWETVSRLKARHKMVLARKRLPKGLVLPTKLSCTSSRNTRYSIVENSRTKNRKSLVSVLNSVI